MIAMHRTNRSIKKLCHGILIMNNNICINNNNNTMYLIELHYNI